MKILGQMQRKAAIWVKGAFRTSPTGGVQAIAGLLPIHLHIRKLSWRASFRTATPVGHTPGTLSYGGGI